MEVEERRRGRAVRNASKVFRGHGRNRVRCCQQLRKSPESWTPCVLKRGPPAAASRTVGGNEAVPGTRRATRKCVTGTEAEDGAARGVADSRAQTGVSAEVEGGAAQLCGRREHGGWGRGLPRLAKRRRRGRG
jgi:hypothetical protein